MEDFDFETWSQTNHLNRKTCTTLHSQDLDTLPTLSLTQPVDIMSLDLTAGQKRLIMAGINSIQHHDAELDLPEEEEVVPECVPEELDVDQPELANASLLEAGKTFDQIFERPQQSVPIKDTLILTMRAQTKKPIHVTQFINEKTKKRHASSRKEVVLATKHGNIQDNIVIKTEKEHPYSGILIDEWGAANGRLLNHLLVTGQLLRQDIEYYLAYTTQIFDFAGKYEWESVLDFDYTYRELQAEHNMVWGVFANHLELHLLTPKRPPMSRPGQQYRAAQSYSNPVDCKMFKATGNCAFGENCKYRHVRVFKQGTNTAPHRTEATAQATGWNPRGNMSKN